MERSDTYTSILSSSLPSGQSLPPSSLSLDSCGHSKPSPTRKEHRLHEEEGDTLPDNVSLSSRCDRTTENSSKNETKENSFPLNSSEIVSPEDALHVHPGSDMSSTSTEREKKTAPSSPLVDGSSSLCSLPLEPRSSEEKDCKDNSDKTRTNMASATVESSSSSSTSRLSSSCLVSSTAPLSPKEDDEEAEEEGESVSCQLGKSEETSVAMLPSPKELQSPPDFLSSLSPSSLSSSSSLPSLTHNVSAVETPVTLLSKNDTSLRSCSSQKNSGLVSTSFSSSPLSLALSSISHKDQTSSSLLQEEKEREGVSTASHEHVPLSSPAPVDQAPSLHCESTSLHSSSLLMREEPLLHSPSHLLTKARDDVTSAGSLADQDASKGGGKNAPGEKGKSKASDLSLLETASKDSIDQDIHSSLNRTSSPPSSSAGDANPPHETAGEHSETSGLQPVSSSFSSEVEERKNVPQQEGEEEKKEREDVQENTKETKEKEEEKKIQGQSNSLSSSSSSFSPPEMLNLPQDPLFISPTSILSSSSLSSSCSHEKDLHTTSTVTTAIITTGTHEVLSDFQEEEEDQQRDEEKKEKRGVASPGREQEENDEKEGKEGELGQEDDAKKQEEEERKEEEKEQENGEEGEEEQKNLVESTGSHRQHLHGRRVDAKLRLKFKREFSRTWVDINRAPSWPPIKKNKYLSSDWKRIDLSSGGGEIRVETKKNRIFLNDLCYLFDGVFTQKSTLGRRAGLGLFCERAEGLHKGQIITEFVGWLVDRDLAENYRKQRTASHIVAVQKGFLYIDGAKDPAYGMGGGSFANDGSEFLGGPGNNSQFYHWYDDELGRTRVFLRATADIQYGEEIFVPYDKTYWLDNLEEQAENCPEAFKQKKLEQLRKKYKDPNFVHVPYREELAIQRAAEEEAERKKKKFLREYERKRGKGRRKDYPHLSSSTSIGRKEMKDLEKRKKKSSSSVKRPMTAYLLYSIHRRREMYAETFPSSSSSCPSVSSCASLLNSQEGERKNILEEGDLVERDGKKGSVEELKMEKKNSRYEGKSSSSLPPSSPEEGLRKREERRRKARNWRISPNLEEEEERSHASNTGDLKKDMGTSLREKEKKKSSPSFIDRDATPSLRRSTRIRKEKNEEEEQEKKKDSGEGATLHSPIEEEEEEANKPIKKEEYEDHEKEEEKRKKRDSDGSPRKSPRKRKGDEREEKDVSLHPPQKRSKSTSKEEKEDPKKDKTKKKLDPSFPHPESEEKKRENKKNAEEEEEREEKKKETKPSQLNQEANAVSIREMYAEFTKKIAEEWRALSLKEKTPWIQLAEKDRRRYFKEKSAIETKRRKKRPTDNRKTITMQKAKKSLLVSPPSSSSLSVGAGAENDHKEAPSSSSSSSSSNTGGQGQMKRESNRSSPPGFGRGSDESAKEEREEEEKDRERKREKRSFPSAAVERGEAGNEARQEKKRRGNGDEKEEAKEKMAGEEMHAGGGGKHRREKRKDSRNEEEEERRRVLVVTTRKMTKASSSSPSSFSARKTGLYKSKEEEPDDGQFVDCCEGEVSLSSSSPSSSSDRQYHSPEQKRDQEGEEEEKKTNKKEKEEGFDEKKRPEGKSRRGGSTRERIARDDLHKEESLLHKKNGEEKENRSKRKKKA